MWSFVLPVDLLPHWMHPIFCKRQYSKEVFFLWGKGFVDFLFFNWTCYYLLKAFWSDLYHGIEGSGSSVVIATGLLLYPSGNFHHWIHSKDADGSLVLEFFTVKCSALSWSRYGPQDESYFWQIQKSLMKFKPPLSKAEATMHDASSEESPSSEVQVPHVKESVPFLAICDTDCFLSHLLSDQLPQVLGTNPLHEMLFFWFSQAVVYIHTFRPRGIVLPIEAIWDPSYPMWKRKHAVTERWRKMAPFPVLAFLLKTSVT